MKVKFLVVICFSCLIQGCSKSGNKVYLKLLFDRQEVIIDDYEVFNLDLKGETYDFASPDKTYFVYIKPKQDLTFSSIDKLVGATFVKDNIHLNLVLLSSLNSLPLYSKSKHFICVDHKGFLNLDDICNERSIILETKNKDELFRFVNRDIVNKCN